MTWDAHDGYVLLFGGWGSGGFVPETWTYLHGQWKELFPTSCPPCNPDVNTWGYYPLAMAYDPAMQEVILSSGESSTYAYSGGEWTNITSSVGQQLTPFFGTSGFPEFSLSGIEMAYDPVGGYMIEMGGKSGSSGVFDGSTWELLDGKWKLIRVAFLEPTSPENIAFGMLAYDPALGCMVLFGGLNASINSGPTDYWSTTWLNCNGNWVNVTQPGDSPPPVMGGTMVYDAADGYMLLLTSGSTYAGYSPATPYGAAHGSTQPLTSNYGEKNNSTWILSTPPLTLGLNVTVAPTAICSLTAPGCPVGGTSTRVTLSAQVVTSSRNLIAAGAPGNSWTWLDAPTLTYVGWGSVSVPNGSAAGWTESCTDSLEVRVPCGMSATQVVVGPGCLGSGGGIVGLRPDAAGVGGGEAPCGGPGTPTQEATPNGASGFVWTWNMSTAWNNTLALGDHWSVSFVVESTGTVPGPEPVDACVASGCRAGGSGSQGGWYTAVGYHPYGNGTVVNVSFPLGQVLVLGGGSTSSVVSSHPPPAPGMPTAVPTPSAVPAPSPISPLPLATGTLTGIGISLGVGSIAAGVVAAGLERSVRSLRQGVRTAVATKVGGGLPRRPRR